MVSVYKTIDDKLEQLDVPEKGCWVNMTAPTHEEVFKIARRLNMDKDFLAAALDEEESARIESDDGRLLVVVDVPIRRR